MGNRIVGDQVEGGFVLVLRIAVFLLVQIDQSERRMDAGAQSGGLLGPDLPSHRTRQKLFQQLDRVTGIRLGLLQMWLASGLVVGRPLGHHARYGDQRCQIPRVQLQSPLRIRDRVLGVVQVLVGIHDGLGQIKFQGTVRVEGFDVP